MSFSGRKVRATFAVQRRDDEHHSRGEQPKSSGIPISCRQRAGRLFVLAVHELRQYCPLTMVPLKVSSNSSSNTQTPTQRAIELAISVAEETAAAVAAAAANEDSSSRANTKYYYWKFGQTTSAAIIFFMIVIGNVSILNRLKRCRRRRSNVNYFIIQLAIADLFVGVFSLALDSFLRLQKSFPYGLIACQASKYISVSCTFRPASGRFAGPKIFMISERRKPTQTIAGPKLAPAIVRRVARVLR